MRKETKFYATALCDGDTINKGEKFEIINFMHKDCPIYGNVFYVKSKRTGNRLLCLSDTCFHLNGGNWEITEE